MNEYITLQNNSHYPTNKTFSFNTDLNKIKGEYLILDRNKDYECALIDISYPLNWKIDIGNLEITRNKFFKNGIEFVPNNKEIKTVIPADEKTLIEKDKIYKLEYGNHVFYKKSFKFEVCNNLSALELYEYIFQKFETLYSDSKGLKFNLEEIIYLENVSNRNLINSVRFSI